MAKSSNVKKNVKTSKKKKEVNNKKKIKNIKESKKNNSILNKRYISFTLRVILYFILFLVIFFGAILLFLNSLNFIQQKNINYVEKSKLDYKVYLKENDFYDSSYLGKDLLYIASLIDKINVNFDYDFNADENVDLDFNYKIIGKLSIMDVNESNTYLEKEYVLLEEKEFNLVNNNKFSISENINVDYNYYNSLVNKFRTTYGIDVSSKLTLLLQIEKDKSNDDELNVSDLDFMSVVVPLSEKSINISLDYNEIDDASYFVSDSNIIVENVICLIVSGLLVILSIIIFIKFMRLVCLLKVNKSKYDKYINRLLNEYDRLIVETSTCPDLSGDNVIVIDKFEELLDVRDNLRLPIMYFVVNMHQKCYFYIIHENKIYLNVVKAVDLEENKQ